MGDAEVQTIELNDKGEGSPPVEHKVEGDASVPITTAEPNGQATDLKNGSVAEATTTSQQDPPPSVEKGIMPEEFALNAVLQQLTSGTEMTKIKSRGKRLVRQYRISRDLHYLCWWPSRKGTSHSRSECMQHTRARAFLMYVFNVPVQTQLPVTAPNDGGSVFPTCGVYTVHCIGTPLGCM